MCYNSAAYSNFEEPRSIRVIDRTVIPVIKVQTKDSQSRQIQLDITFDSPEHFGLQAAELVNSLMIVSFPIYWLKKSMRISHTCFPPFRIFP